MKKAILILCVLLLFPTMAFSKVNTSNTVVTDLHNNIVITLESNRTTGYHWELAKPLDNKFIELIGSDYVRPTNRLVIGAYGRETWTFKPKKYGNTTIFLKYVRPWEKDVPPIKTRRFTVQIVKDTSGQEPAKEAEKLTAQEAAGLIGPLARDVILCLKSEDINSLAGFADSKGGIRFSPYALVDRKNDRVIMTYKLAATFKTPVKMLWGKYQNTGDQILLSFKDYYKEFIWDRDYSVSEQISFSEPIGVSNTLNNSKQAYPKAVIVEYYLPGLNPKYEGMDWKCLRLVFEKRQERWCLIGIIHDAWAM